ncbi:hypothetical protein QTP88_022985 [Uroleucon formosanum]
MPRERRANIGRRTRHASQQQVYSRNLREERQNIIRENDRLRHRVSTRRSLASYNRLAFQYDPTANYSDDDTQLVLIENVFPNISENYKNYAWLSQREILAAKNNDVHALNFTIQSKIAGDLVTYKSVDSITNPDDVVNYPTEFLNSLEIPGFPPHNLQLKVGTVIMILRNLNPPRLCNGTRLSVKRLMPNLIEATIINGNHLFGTFQVSSQEYKERDRKLQDWQDVAVALNDNWNIPSKTQKDDFGEYLDI